MSNVPYILDILPFSEKSDKLRLILGLRQVNINAYKDKIKFEDWDEMLNYVKNGCFICKFDLKQGYHQIDIKLEDQNYCGEVKHELRVVNYEFRYPSYEFKSTSYNFKFTSNEFKSTS